MHIIYIYIIFSVADGKKQENKNKKNDRSISPAYAADSMGSAYAPRFSGAGAARRGKQMRVE